jgi:hypothetical protein
MQRAFSVATYSRTHLFQTSQLHLLGSSFSSSPIIFRVHRSVEDHLFRRTGAEAENSSFILATCVYKASIARSYEKCERRQPLCRLGASTYVVWTCNIETSHILGLSNKRYVSARLALVNHVVRAVVHPTCSCNRRAGPFDVQKESGRKHLIPQSKVEYVVSSLSSQPKDVIL